MRIGNAQPNGWSGYFQGAEEMPHKKSGSTACRWGQHRYGQVFGETERLNL